MISIATFRALLPTTFIKRMKLNTLPCAIYYQVLKHLFPIFLPPYVTHIARSNRRKQVAIETGSIEKTVRHSTNQVQHYETHKHNKPTSRLVMVTLYSSQTMLPGLRARSEFAWITKTSWRYYKAGASPTSHPPPPHLDPFRSFIRTLAAMETAFSAVTTLSVRFFPSSEGENRRAPEVFIYRHPISSTVG